MPFTLETVPEPPDSYSCSKASKSVLITSTEASDVPALVAEPAAAVADPAAFVADVLALDAFVEAVFAEPDAEGNLDEQKVWARALGNTLIVPSSILMGAVKIVDSTVGNFGELIGLTPYRQQRETLAVTGAVKRIGKGVVLDGIDMATTDNYVTDEKKEKYWLNLQGMAPIANTPLMELPARLIIKQFRDNE